MTFAVETTHWHPTAEERLVWVDMETTGLIPHKSIPLEIGFAVTDLELRILSHQSWVIYEQSWKERYKPENLYPFIVDMHSKSGLWDEVGTKGRSRGAVEKEVEEYLEDWGVEGGVDPMCGSSVQFDREWMRYWFPSTFERFSYRNIDISTIKELMKRFSPDIYADIEGTENNTTKRGLHRVDPDLEDTISEFKFYRKEFLYVPTDFS